ncbi:MAG: DUF4129 domain-containing protein, partial [Pseudomonadota bacterium]
RLGGAFLHWLDRGFSPPPPGKPLEINFFAGCVPKAPKDEASLTRKSFTDGTGTEDEHVLLWLVIAGLILAAGLIFLKIRISRGRGRPEPVKALAFEATTSRTGFFKALSNLLGGMRALLRRLFAFILTLASTLSPRPKNAAILSSTRGLYRALLRWAAGQGIPRSPSQTPLEYLTTLCGKFPQRERELSLITEAYMRVRYGRTPPGREEFEEAATAWKRVEEGIEL